jgi:Flp pilus assembly protein TadD
VYEELAAAGYRPRDTHERLVSIYLRLRKGEDALRHAEALREFDPADRKLRGEIADLHVLIGREEEGISELVALWKEDRSDLAPAKRVVEIRLAGDRFAEAEPLLREMLAAHPEDAWCWTRLSYALLRLGDSDGSLRALERAVAADPADAGAAFLLGNTYFATGRLEDALREFERARASGLRTAELLGKKAAAEAELGRPEAAIETLRELLRLEPENASAQNHLGYLLSDLGRDLDEAERLVMRAIEQHPENPFFRDSLGWVYFRKGDYEGAVRELRSAHDGRGEDPVILEHLADALAASGRVREAAEAYRAVLRIRPENAGAARKLREIAEP